ncbi:NAD(P)-binding protein [Thozetella sp. PMI_491]|nr:NAD(P)-binding protein [Thozetella sp. PMI_491]
MPSYLITGVSRGIGFEFLRQLSSDPNNTIVGLVRDKSSTDQKVANELGDRKNISIMQADLTDWKAIQATVDETAKITGGSLDYLIANAGFVSRWSALNTLGNLGAQPDKLEADMMDLFRINVVGNVHLFNAYMPLILKGSVKKVLLLSTGLADMEMTNKWSLYQGAPYSISKTAANAMVAKYNAEYGKDGVLFLAVCPGAVATGHNANPNEEELVHLMDQGKKFMEYAPHFTGEVTVESSVKDVLSVLNEKSLAGGDGGAFYSHLGNKQWL